MHELSVAVSIVEIACEEGERLGGRVCAVHVRLGALSGIAPEALSMSFEVACMDTPLVGSKLVIEEVPAAAFCEVCRAERELRSIQSICCSECGTPAAEVSQGKELQLVALEIEE